MSESGGERDGTDEWTRLTLNNEESPPHLPTVTHNKDGWGPTFLSQQSEDDSEERGALLDLNANEDIQEVCRESSHEPESRISDETLYDSRGNVIVRHGEESSITSNPNDLTASEISTNRKLQLGEFCRICHESDNGERFLSPCQCKGTLSLVHRSCLQRWLAQSDTNKCELCGHAFTIKRLSKYGLLSSMCAWLARSSRERRRLILDMARFVFMCPALCLINFFSFKLSGSLYLNSPYTPLLQELPFHQEMLAQDTWDRILVTTAEVLILSLMMTLDVAFLMWVFLKMQHHFSKWYSWYRRSCEVTLIGYKELTGRKRNTVHQEPTSSSIRIRSISF